jgi:hypothetical protein
MSVVIDSPTVTVTADPTKLNLQGGTGSPADNTATVTFTFSAAPADFGIAHISATDGTVTGLTAVDTGGTGGGGPATTYKATFTPVLGV